QYTETQLQPHYHGRGHTIGHGRTEETQTARSTIYLFGRINGQPWEGKVLDGIRGGRRTATGHTRNSQGIRIIRQGRTHGLIAGIIATPQDQDVCIRLDNQAVAKMFNDIVVNRRRASVRAKLRCDYAVEWAIVARICSERTGSTSVEWVKGHRGDKWNVAA
ncbi:hypothetical protein K457DRAFT_1898669, partial [Linnemannia elongata AG-77]